MHWVSRLIAQRTHCNTPFLCQYPDLPLLSGSAPTSMNSMHHFDIVIIGAGPAGSATALALRKGHPRLSVLLCETSDFQQPRPGETLCLDAVPVLQQLEVFDFFLEQNHNPVARQFGNADLGNGAAKFIENNNAQGGWHIDRPRFDSMLAGYAAASGASFMRAGFARAKLSSDGPWQLTAHSANTARSVSASFIVDASGRSARFASEIGVAQFAHDSLLGVVRVLEVDDADHGTRMGGGQSIEAFEHGWWYAAPLSEKRLAVAVMTDADICKRLQLTQLSEWMNCLLQAPKTRERLAGLKDRGEMCVRAAHTRNLSCYAGNNWLAVGDAAASIDPLASQGVLRALRFGLHAGNAIGEQFNSRLPDLADYQKLVQAEFDNSLVQRTEDYRAEQRWIQSPFWERRHNANIVTQQPGTAGEKKITLSINSSAGRAPASASADRVR